MVFSPKRVTNKRAISHAFIHVMYTNAFLFSLCLSLFFVGYVSVGNIV